MAKKADKTNIDAVKTEPVRSKRGRTEAKKVDAEAVLDVKKPVASKSAPAKKEPVLTTILQVSDKEYNITDIAEKALKAYKSVHKRKTITEFVVYVKPEENAAYYTVNGEGAEEYKIEL